MTLPLQELAYSERDSDIVRLTENGLEFVSQPRVRAKEAALIPQRPLGPGEQYRFHFNMTKCIGCRSCEVACNEQNGNPAEIHWRRIGEIEGGSWPLASRFYLSMGCNHCLSADCLHGCPVDAYKKDPTTGIVLHSAEACIGCQYCVWNCPYSVPQFNAERGVVGKCDMCHGRLTTGLEPACVNACPENAIEIEIVDQLEWRSDYAAANAPGMPSAGHTISTTRITLPQDAVETLERVDVDTLRPEHSHPSLIWMTSLIQLSVGTLVAALCFRCADPLALTLICVATTVALSVSVLHLGRPAFAWRALKMWRRSWLSREVLLFTLFFVALSSFTAADWLVTLRAFSFERTAVFALGVLAAILGVAGILASARIYLVPARPAWNTVHTPLDFLLSSALLGSAALPLLQRAAHALSKLPLLTTLPLIDHARMSTRPIIFVAAIWAIHQIVRTIRLLHSSTYEHRASISLINTDRFRGVFLVSFGLAGLVILLAATDLAVYALPAALTAILASRYLFFVSVVPLNMALTFVRSARA